MRRFIAILTAVLAGSTVLLTAAPAQATEHGKNGRIAFRRYYNADHTRGDIFTVRSDGTAERQVTHSARTRLATEPDWSPNGHRIVYMLSRHGDLDNSRLFTIRSNGTHRTALASCHIPCLADGFAQWSPSGKRIAFQRALGPALGQLHLFAIYVMRADGTHPRRVTHKGTTIATDHRFYDLAPAWSPTAARLAFERLDGKTDHHAIFTVRLDGTGLRRITRWRLDASQPDWSPNGRWIMFRSKETSDDSGNVWLVHPNGTGLHAVTHTPPGTGKWSSGSFSPNGRRISNSFTPGHGKAGNADVYVLRLDGTHIRNVTSSFAWESAPDWGPRPG
jgi:Tol biopolymer transport system component